MKNGEPSTLFNNSLELDCFCLDLVEQAKEFYEKNPKRRGDKTVQERVEFWIENDLTPALENAIEDTFEGEENEDD